MTKKLVIGCGYLGDRIARKWSEQGHQVYATTRRQNRAGKMRQLGWHPVLMDVAQEEPIRELPQVDTVVYCVGLDRGSGKSMREIYVAGLRNVLDYLPRPKRFIYVSSTGVYGQDSGEDVDEQASTEPTTESGRVVLEAEHLLREHIPSAIIQRFAGIYGPERLFLAEPIRRGDPVRGNPDQWLNLIHVDDGVTAVLAAETMGKPGETYNVSDGAAPTRREFYGTIAELLHAPPVTFTDGPTLRGGHRRILNRRLIEELQVKLRYPNYRAGLQSIVANQP